MGLAYGIGQERMRRKKKMNKVSELVWSLLRYDLNKHKWWFAFIILIIILSVPLMLLPYILYGYVVIMIVRRKRVKKFNEGIETAKKINDALREINKLL